MAIAIDASSPANVSGSGSAKTTVSFNPPGNSLLVACFGFEGGLSGVTVSNNGTALTWTARASAINLGASGSAFIYTAYLASAQTGMTVTATSGKSSDTGGLKLFVVTGVDSTAPVGKTATGSQFAGNINVNAYTATKPDTLGIFMCHDWSGEAAPSAPSGYTGTGWLVSGHDGGIGEYTTAASTTTGQQIKVQANTTAGGAEWNWAAIELLPGTAAPATPAFSGWGVPIF
jgi:hypothetical protein